jgi:uncharacterized protein
MTDNVKRLFLLAAIALLLLSGCSGGHSSRTLGMRTALDQGDPRRALDLLNRELKVQSDAVLPRSMKSANALLVLDRATIQQSVAQVDGSKRDYEAADKAIDALDLSHGAPDVVGRWLYSDSAGRYVAPPYEKLLVNVLNMVNYLETNDLSGARIEARRMSVAARYLRDQDRGDGAALRFGSRLAGFTYEKSGNPEEARRYYDDANVREDEPSLAPPSDAESGELLVIVGWGRVPHRIAQHVSIGLAMQRAAPFLSAADESLATRVAAHGLLTWVSYPTLAPEVPLAQLPSITVDGRAATLETILDVSAEARAEWKRIEGEVMAAALSRAVTRAAVAGAIDGIASTSKNEKVRAAGFILSLVAQIAMTAADVPDTRSWETLPARLGLARVRVSPGPHRVVIDARGYHREGNVQMASGGWTVTSMLALR